MIYSKLTQWNLKNKRVLLRADLNVPLQGTTISNDFRLQSILPTLDYLLNNDNMVILVTHIGKPKDHEENLSTKLLVPWFKECHYTISYAPNPLFVSNQPTIPGTIILLENVRFFPEEQSNNPLFAKELAQMADYYVNDAFGAMHRNDCSIASVPYEFLENRRTIGFLVEKELRVFSLFKKKPEHPALAILGGKKIEDKIPLIEGLLDIMNEIFICPALCFSFLAAQNYQVGTSLVDEKTFKTCLEIIKNAENKQILLTFPMDYQIADKNIGGKLSYCDASQFPTDAYGISIGPKTIDLFAKKIATARTIFVNCAMGFAENPQTQQSTHSLLQHIASSHATKIAAGGDTIDMVFKAGVEKSFDHLSTGGGAALAFISNEQLPGLLPFEEDQYN